MPALTFNEPDPNHLRKKTMDCALAFMHVAARESLCCSQKWPETFKFT